MAQIVVPKVTFIGLPTALSEERGGVLMNEQQVEQGKGTPHIPERGIMMFKDHIAAMKSGSWRLGGDRESAQCGDEQSVGEAGDA